MFVPSLPVPLSGTEGDRPPPQFVPRNPTPKPVGVGWGDVPRPGAGLSPGMRPPRIIISAPVRNVAVIDPAEDFRVLSGFPLGTVVRAGGREV